ncbi:ABC transporter substrate-binding protein [Kribbella sandramycini]|uniref:ABC transporter substrate-binding protein n=1 Tax=Kribbella sandramycini TaxID=60450 RepID=A0A7Y4NY28_9ACTN|nr:ABC transporter substrate-binding protein [Kribbella sandramycini]MBB6569666.1 peptide/nickel transport system substrate-binding protein [Kribbella sandramycini]NOL40502.1 ABC transporter substrate-binding protein [Kribbella sandramycini]
MTLSRRVLLRSAGLGAAAVALPSACGAAASGQTPVQATASATPKPGGTLRAVFTGGGATESLDPYVGGAPVDLVRHEVMYDALFRFRGNEVEAALALAAKPVAGQGAFDLELRPDVVWHDGTAFTARDVLASFAYMSSPERAYPSELSAYFDFAKATVTGPLTLRIPTRQPIGEPALLLASYPAKIVKPGKSIGTGPYQVDAFAAGREARLKKFDRYWEKTAVSDELVLSSLTDPQAKVNAVLSGQSDFSTDIPFTIAKTGTSNAELEIRTAGPLGRVGFGFVLNATKAPFKDPRARKAVRLGIDRQALVDSVLLGFGAPGNDLFGAGSKHFDSREPLARDVDQARTLLKDAGAAGATVVFRTAEYEIGYNASTQLVAEQLRELGLMVKIDQVGVPEFFDVKALGQTDGIVFSIGALPLPVTYSRLAAYPTLGLPDAELKTALGAALAATDEPARAKAWATAQQIMTDRGNTVVWGQADTLSIARKSVAGVETRAGQEKYPYLGRAGLA